MDLYQIKKNQCSDCKTCNCLGQKNGCESKKCNVLNHETPASSSRPQLQSSSKIGQELIDNIDQLISMLNESLDLTEEMVVQIESRQALVCRDPQCQRTRCKKGVLHPALQIVLEEDRFDHTQITSDLKKLEDIS